MRPIDAEKLFDNVRHLGVQHIDGFGETVCLIDVLEMIAEAPTVDSAEKEAYWMDHNGERNDRSEYSLYCSACGDWNEKRENYCPHCGYKMDNPVADLGERIAE